ncbi:MAG: hypothetical protein ACXVEF_24345 [Polyangiales bacterium]
MTSRDEVAGLLEKYQTMRALRSSPGEPPRDVLRDLAQRFPGALAEIDRIAPSLLDERIAQLQSILERPRIEHLPDWVRGWLLTHARLRGALAIKAWLAGKRVIDDATRAQFSLEIFGEEALAWSTRLELIADPPGGRIVTLVYEEVGRTLGIPPTDVRTLLMPRP